MKVVVVTLSAAIPPDSDDQHTDVILALARCVKGNGWLWGRFNYQVVEADDEGSNLEYQAIAPGDAQSMGEGGEYGEPD
jgi:hypothetical protein